jgi:Glyoxalase/Bleomycin resistance protein/Dioxygenase superfamily
VGRIDRPATKSSQLSELSIGDPSELWEALGFTVRDGQLQLGRVRIRLGVEGRGITSWSVSGVEATDIDGLPTTPASSPSQQTSVTHPNGATGIDHVVIATPDFDRTAAALEAQGMPLRRVRDAGGFRQGFRRIGPAILELVEAKTAPPGPARFWGLVVIVTDVEALAERLADRLGSIKKAVQPGRHIATLRSSAGLGQQVAFMDPEP